MKKLLVLTILLILIGAGLTFKLELFASKKPACHKNISKKKLEVRGQSMEPLLKNGDQLDFFKNYYSCYPVKRGDLVAAKVGRKFVVKRIVGIPKDSFELKGSDIFINGELLKNSQGKSYQVQSKMLKLYAKDYPTIPGNAYFLLGEKINGTLDSTRFGLISKDAIKGKILKSQAKPLPFWQQINKIIDF